MDIDLQQAQQTVKIPLITESNANSSYTFNGAGVDELFVNWVPMSLQTSYPMLGHPREQWLEKREGFTYSGWNWLTGLSPTLQPTAQVLDGIAITSVYGIFILAVQDTTLNGIYIVYLDSNSNTSQIIGNIATTKDYQVFLTEISQAVSGNLLPGVSINCTARDLSGGFAYYVPSITSSGFGALTQITDVNFPSNQTPALIPVGPFVNFNGINYIATLDGQIFNSTINGNDISTWTDSNGNLGVISANAKPDQCVGLARYKNTIVSMGTDSIQFFEDIGNTPCPLQPIPQATITFGCAGSWFYTNINDILYWISFGSASTKGVWMLDNFTPRKISIPWVDTYAQTSLSSSTSFNKVMQGTSFKGKQTLVISLNRTSPAALEWTTNFPGNSSCINQSTDSYSIQAQSCVPTSFCYNIVDNIWWNLLFFPNNQAPSIFPDASQTMPLFLTQFSAPNNGTVTIFAIMTSNLNQVGVFSPSVGPVLQIDQENSYDSYFQVNTPTTETKVPIVAFAQLNTQWFGTTKRKRISRLSYLLSTPVPSLQLPTNIGGLYTYWVRDPDHNTQNWNFSGNLTIVHWSNTALPSAVNRYYVNNLGTGRTWQLMFMDNTMYNTRISGIEADVSLASH